MNLILHMSSNDFKQLLTITKEATTTAPGAFNLSSNQSNAGAAVLLNPIAAITKTVAATTSLL